MTQGTYDQGKEFEEYSEIAYPDVVYGWALPPPIPSECLPSGLKSLTGWWEFMHNTQAQPEAIY